MNKYVITFGSDQLPEFPGNSLKVMLVIEADSERYARDKVFNTSIGGNFCTSYKYDDVAEEFKELYDMEEYTLEDLGV